MAPTARCDDVLESLLDARFTIERFDELGSRDDPHEIALRCRR